ncbi:hypothetical protein MTR_8g038795 [Medicago truncatula]|uniref:Uncharacterized protein n=1 Tax=Medicago truncatula TaxID=3880 RepID=A0A072TNM8_MEDTR|nr:hypothetical protein MTR_8g038795 [Medicago truncatula]
MQERETGNAVKVQLARRRGRYSRNPLAKKGDVAIATDGLPGEMYKLCSKYKSSFPSFQTGSYDIFRERIGRNFTVFIEHECLSVNSSRFFEKSSSWHRFSTLLPLL